MQITRRYGTSPAKRGCNEPSACPDVLSLGDGFVVIGKTELPPDIDSQLAEHGASVGPDEVAVYVPADVMRAAAREIAAEQLSTA